MDPAKSVDQRTVGGDTTRYISRDIGARKLNEEESTRARCNCNFTRLTLRITRVWQSFSAKRSVESLMYSTRVGTPSHVNSEANDPEWHAFAI